MYMLQSDVCHAYQILKKGGLKDENIVVFMYDDIANNKLNPRPGVIINRPDGDDVYGGVPKVNFLVNHSIYIYIYVMGYLLQDYTGENVNSKNLFAVLRGDTNAVNGGSGKVLNTTRNDRIFFYYTDHGGPGVLGAFPFSFFFFVKKKICHPSACGLIFCFYFKFSGMPNGPFLFAKDFIEILKEKHKSNSYKEMVRNRL